MGNELAGQHSLQFTPFVRSDQVVAMNILLINHYAGSTRHGMEYRPYYLAREWVRLGHRVKIVAASYAHVRHRNPCLSNLERFDETIDGIEYTWLATPAYQGNGLARIRNMTAFIVHLFRSSRALATVFQPDVVIASSTYPLDIFPAHRIARLAGARLLFEVHDLWPLSPMELGGHSRWHPFIMLLQAAENYACQHADAIVSMLPKVADHLEAHGMAPCKLHIIPNGADPAEWGTETPAAPDALVACLSRLRESGTFIIGYAGSHGTANALGHLLDAARLLRDRPVAFVLVGAGPDKAMLQERALAFGLKKVHFFDAVSKAQIPAFLRAIDLAYIGWQRQSLYRFGIAPNKLIDYMMAGRPVLHAVEAGNDLVTEAQCGLTVMPENPRAVADGVLSLMSLTPEARSAMGQRGRQFVLDQLSYRVLSQQFLHIFPGERRHG
jgi:glycosyltransferase involved in cell wall biosynthesis